VPRPITAESSFAIAIAKVNAVIILASIAASLLSLDHLAVVVRAAALESGCERLLALPPCRLRAPVLNASPLLLSSTPRVSVHI
jgi:hypothetical protein